MDKREEQKGSENKISLKELFTALLRDSISHDKIDGFPLHELQRIYKHRGLNKP